MTRYINKKKSLAYILLFILLGAFINEKLNAKDDTKYYKVEWKMVDKKGMGEKMTRKFGLSDDVFIEENDLAYIVYFPLKKRLGNKISAKNLRIWLNDKEGEKIEVKDLRNNADDPLYSFIINKKYDEDQVYQIEIYVTFMMKRDVDFKIKFINKQEINENDDEFKDWYKEALKAKSKFVLPTKSLVHLY